MKIKKISVRNFMESLTDNELKKVLGGYGASPRWCCCSDGECVPTGCSSTSCCENLYPGGGCKIS